MKNNFNGKSRDQNNQDLNKRLKILLLEDDITIRSLLKTLLKLEGFHVESLEGKEKDIIQSIQKEKPDSLILDIHLHNNNGIDITRTLRLYPEFHDLKIIITSGMDKEKESLSAGANYFLLKPFMPDELIQIIKK